MAKPKKAVAKAAKKTEKKAAKAKKPSKASDVDIEEIGRAHV